MDHLHIAQMMMDQSFVYEQLMDIIHESPDPDAIRSALIALTHTASGRAYLETHPVTL